MRRQRGSGTVYRRRDGRYEACCYVNTSSGIERVRRYAKSRDSAEAILVELRKQNDHGLLSKTAEERLANYLDYWLLKVQSRVRKSTYASYETIVRIYLKPKLGKMFLSKLNVANVQTFLDNELLLGQSVRNVHKMRIVLSAALSHAVWEDRLFRNVARSTRLPTYHSKEIVPWTPDELVIFLTKAKSHQFFAIYLMLSVYGLRTSELLGLSWSDLDMSNEIIQVRRQLDYYDGVFSYGELKTRYSKRDLPLIGLVTDAISKQPRTPLGPLPDLIFKTSNGNPIDRGNLLKSFQRLSREAGVRVITLHDLRHTAATNFKNLGVTPRDAKSILGHAHISTTLQIYQHSDLQGTADAIRTYESKISDLIVSSRQLKPSIADNTDNLQTKNSGSGDKT